MTAHIPSPQELKPCPFCGRTPKGIKKDGGSSEISGYNFFVGIICECGVSVHKPSHEDENGWCNDRGEAVAALIEAWNRRTP